MIRVPILMYHKVAERPAGTFVPHHYVSPARFRRHCRALAAFGFRTAGLTEVGRLFDSGRDCSGRLIALSFDDGYQNFADHALPVLRSRGQTATVFVVTGLVGSVNEWDVANGDVLEPLMDRATLAGLVASGVEVGCHSMTHARLTECDDATLRVEVADARQKLGEDVGAEVRVFCYPYGAHDGRVRDAVRQAGYNAACSVEKGWNTRQTDRFRWRRVNVRSDTSTPVLFWKLWRQSLLSQGRP